MARVAEITNRADAQVQEVGEKVRFTRSSGNVFKDLGLENPDDLLQKSRLVSVIHSVMRKRRLSQSEAAQMMGVSQPDLSKLIRGRTAGFSMERLVTMLSAIGVSTHITLEVPTRFTHRGRIVVDEVQQDQRKPQVF